MRATTEIDKVVGERCDALAEEFAGLAEDPYLREAIMKQAIRDFSWALLHYLEISKYELADQLEAMSDAVRAHKDDGAGA